MTKNITYICELKIKNEVLFFQKYPKYNYKRDKEMEKPYNIVYHTNMYTNCKKENICETKTESSGPYYVN